MSNIALLTTAISSLKTRSESLSDIVEKYIKPIDNNEYVFDFSKKNYDFYSYRIPCGNSDTFGSAMIKKPNEDLYELAHSLKLKYDESNPNVTDEIRILENSLKKQRDYLKEISSKEIEDMKVIIKLMKNIIAAINQ